MKKSKIRRIIDEALKEVYIIKGYTSTGNHLRVVIHKKLNKLYNEKHK